MRLIGAHVRAKVQELLRIPGLLVPTVLFPCLLFLFLGAPNAHTPGAAASRNRSLRHSLLTWRICNAQKRTNVIASSRPPARVRQPTAASSTSGPRMTPRQPRHPAMNSWLGRRRIG